MEDLENMDNYDDIFQDNDDGIAGKERLDIGSNSITPSQHVRMPKSLFDCKREINSIEDIKDLEESIAMERSSGCQLLFRGYVKNDCSLLPSIVWNNVKDYGQEREVLEVLKKICKSKGYDNYKMPNFNDNLFYMSIGRHLRLHSRLLDWTASLWVALSFIMEEKDGGREYDGTLWLLMYQDAMREPQNADPFSFNDTKLHLLREDYYLPNDSELPVGILRRGRQRGFFSVMPEKLLDTPLNEVARSSGYKLIDFTITKKAKSLLVGNPNLISVDYLYGNQNDSSVEEIRNLNNLFEYKSGNDV